MKTPIFILLILMNLSCKSQYHKTETMDTGKNKKEIQEQASSLKEGDTIMMKDGKLDLRALRQEYRNDDTGDSTNDTIRILDYFQYEKTLPNGTYVDISGDEQDGFSKTIRERDSNFEMYAEYYGSGETKQIGKLYAKEFTKGIWYWFSESGEIEKYEDYDAPFDYSWEDVQLFLKNHKVSNESIHQIGRSVQDKVPLWYVSFKTEDLGNTDNVQQYILNGTTGEVVKKQLLDISLQLD
ncbi:hypothetical protein N9954_09165 [Maribacter sp.]|nr:hypothetical protein [Maribacter sp.]